MPGLPREKKKKVDYGALQSPFMRIPRMDARAARALLDLGFKEVYELRGRDPNVLFCEYRKMMPASAPEISKFIKNAVDFAEIEDGA